MAKGRTTQYQCGVPDKSGECIDTHEVSVRQSKQRVS